MKVRGEITGDEQPTLTLFEAIKSKILDSFRRYDRNRVWCHMLSLAGMHCHSVAWIRGGWDGEV